MSAVLITANRLRDGVVLWLGPNLKWSECRTNAALFNDEQLPAAQQVVADDSALNEVTAVYEIPVNGIADLSMRERVRALGGPTIEPPKDYPQQIDSNVVITEGGQNVQV